MRASRFGWFITSVALTSAATPATATHPKYNVVAIGPLSSDINTEADDVNAAGTVVGLSGNPFAYQHAIRWQDGVTTNLGGLGGTGLNGMVAGAFGINNDGHIAGRAYAVNGDSHAFLLRSGTSNMIDLDPGFLHPWSVAYDVAPTSSNPNFPMVVGFLNDVQGERAFVAAPVCNPVCSYVMFDPVLLAGKTQALSTAWAINSAGHVTGEWSEGTVALPNQAFFYRHFPNYDLVTLPGLGGSYSSGRDLNESDDVVGEAGLPGNAGSRPVVWYGGTGPAVVLGSLGGVQAGAYGINNAGRIVGWADDAGFNDRAFVYSAADGLVDLNTLIPPGSGWVLTIARKINDHGQITGQGTFGGLPQGFLLSECGNSIVEPGEQCDDGANNGTSCCTSFCQRKAVGSACSSDGNACTVDQCGVAGVCQHDGGGCDPSRSVEALVGGAANACTGGTPVPGGCRVTAGNVTLTIPNGALPTATNIALRAMFDSACNQYNSLQGNNGRVVECYQFLPEGTVFSIPIEAQFAWTPCPNACDVNWSGGCGNPLAEGRTMIFLNGTQVADQCKLAGGTCLGTSETYSRPCFNQNDTLCDQAVCSGLTNSWTIQGLRHFSEFVLGTERCADLQSPMKLKVRPMATNNKVLFAGYLPLDLMGVDPAATGLEFVLNDHAPDGGDLDTDPDPVTLLYASIPPGPFDAALGIGWKSSANHLKYTYVNRSPNPPGGVGKLVLKGTAGDPLVKLKVKALPPPAVATTEVAAELRFPDTGACYGTGPGAMTCAPNGASGVSCSSN